MMVCEPYFVNHIFPSFGVCILNTAHDEGLLIFIISLCATTTVRCIEAGHVKNEMSVQCTETALAC